MKKSIQSLFFAAIVGLTAVCVQAAETASQVVVLKVKGAATALIPGSTTPVEVKSGDKFPQGTKLETADASAVEIQVFPGTTATIDANTKVDLTKLSLSTANGVVTKQSSVIGISLGSIVSKIDPSKKAINDYSISTPKGVAAARGTEYEVFVSGSGEVRILVKKGAITFSNMMTPPQSVTVQVGYYVTVDKDGTISEPIKWSNAESNSAGESGNDKAAKDFIDTTIIVSPSS